MTSLAQIKTWSERFPFDEGELEIILRCHASLISDKKGGGSFLNLLAHSFPYVFFFLPQDELEIRTSLVETYILPPGFGERFKETIFKTRKTDKEEDSIENLIDGVSKSCRGEPEDALEIIFDCCSNEEGTAKPKDLVDLCYGLSIASSILVSKRIEEKRVKSFQHESPPLHGLKSSLSTTIDGKGNITKSNFVDWGTRVIPFIYACLPTFTHNLIFHGKSTKSHHEATYEHPELLDCSDIFTSDDVSFPYTICCMAPNMGGKWRRLFTSAMEETPANCLQAAIGHHVGPSFFIIKTESDGIVGGCVESKWKVCYFLFEIEPLASIYGTSQGKFFVNHDEKYDTEAGEKKGFGFYEDSDDAAKWSSSHLFFSFPLEVCIASFLKERSKIKVLEVWGMGVELYD